MSDVSRSARRPNAWGFTLIEMAIVLVVVGLLLSGGLLAIAPVIQGSRESETKGKLERIDQALTVYVIQNGCLPCPANGSLLTTDDDAGWSHNTTVYYGPGGPTSQPCAGSAGCNANGGAGAGLPLGLVPWKTLGVSRGDALDAWGNYISYAVSDALATTSGSSMVRASGTYPAGGITVRNNNATPRTQTTTAAYVLISHGRDGAFAFNQAAVQNADPHGSAAGDPQGLNAPSHFTIANGARQDGEAAIEGATYFDDIVRWRTVPVMIQACGAGSCGNPD